MRQLCRVLVLCVQHCHDLGIVHRDLRPEHMLLSSSENDATVKLTGFDFARSLPRDGSGGSGRRGKRGLLASEPYVTAEYAAPEVLRDDPYGKVREEGARERPWSEKQGGAWQSNAIFFCRMNDLCSC